ncbi:hypothetical protein GCM10012275_13040 [Longimycelium tulufanense]|uniref:Sigma-70 family RNA polymerase sigma factor n=1 Tax=Longimycelium tulufanense TaxID=907463 RepID=A0A8J3FSW7_9PSEU|nr:sigma-70 family RNA polymerase sigma factor [Longimycelium tulufanense]GGM43462.1 hypothetical protein GCM10012275_13040 [Longimycelium tulufanense]
MNSHDLAHAVHQVVRRYEAAGVPRQDAEDCVHDSLVKMLARLARGDGEVERVEAWLAVATQHQLVDRHRRAQRERAALRRVHAPVAPDPGEAVADRQLARWLVDHLSALPPVTQQVCWALADGLTTEQASVQLGLSRRSVESHLTRARRHLRGLAAGTTHPTITRRAPTGAP